MLGEFFGGGLANGGETIRVLDPFGDLLVEVSYDDAAIWPQVADGQGTSLQLINEEQTPADQLGKYYSWQNSLEYGGSPGRAGAAPIGIVINEILANTDPQSATGDAIELFNTSDQTIDLGGWYLSDAADKLTKFRIPANTQLSAGGYLVLTEAQFNADPQDGFASEWHQRRVRLSDDRRRTGASAVRRGLGPLWSVAAG